MPSKPASLIETPNNVLTGLGYGVGTFALMECVGVGFILKAPFDAVKAANATHGDSAIVSLHKNVTMGACCMFGAPFQGAVQILRGVVNTPGAVYDAVCGTEPAPDTIAREDELNALIEKTLNFGGLFNVAEELTLESAEGPDVTTYLQENLMRQPDGMVDGVRSGLIALVTMPVIGVQTLLGLSIFPHMWSIAEQQAERTNNEYGLRVVRTTRPMLRSPYSDSLSSAAYINGLMYGVSLPLSCVPVSVVQVCRGVGAAAGSVQQVVLKMILGEDHYKVFSFFEGLTAEHPKGARNFVNMILSYGGVFPKLAQRLRLDRNTVTCKELRKALAKVMEECTPHTENDVVNHLLEHDLVDKDTQTLKYLKTLGTGSVAQTVLVEIDGVQRVMKMTWPSDEQRFKDDFEMIGSLLDRLECENDSLHHLPRVSQLYIFLKAVLSKRTQLLQEFDLRVEYENAKRGMMAFEKYTALLTANRIAAPCFDPIVPGASSSVLSSAPPMFTVKVPYVIWHGKHLLEQELASGTSLESLGNWFQSKTFNPALPTSLQQILDLWEIVRKKNTVTEACTAYIHTFLPLHGCMLLHEGWAHADAHTGNILYNEDSKTLWVIDWGAVVALNSEKTCGLRTLINCLAQCAALPVDDLSFDQVEWNFARTDLGISFWQHLFHPAKYSCPAHLEFQNIKESFEDPHMVLCLEAIFLASRSLQQIGSSKVFGDASINSLLSIWSQLPDAPAAPILSKCDSLRSGKP